MGGWIDEEIVVQIEAGLIKILLVIVARGKGLT